MIEAADFVSGASHNQTLAAMFQLFRTLLQGIMDSTAAFPAEFSGNNGALLHPAAQKRAF